jgi:DNA polymerase I-like protein with 3'-5' exonuclease and polymerase domains
VKWDDQRFVAFDFETSGELPEYALQPWRVKQGKSWVTSLAVVRKDAASVVITGGLNPTRGDMERFLRDAITENRTIVGWNTVFDIMWLLAYGFEDLVFQAKWLDGMLLWRHFSIEPEYEATAPKRKSYSLKTCVKELWPEHGGYEEDIDFHDPNPVVRSELHRYNIKDTIFTIRAARHWWKKMGPRQQRAALIEAASLPAVAQANLEGMYIDPLAAAELDQHLANQAHDSLVLLAPLGVNEEVVRSPRKLATVIYDEWGLKPFKETATGARSTDKEVLHELSLKDQRVAELRRYREALNNRTKFAQMPMAAAKYSGCGRAHPLALIFGTYSGRLTYASSQGKNKEKRQIGFALHQTKRDPMYRSLVVAPPGHTLVEFDAAGQEFRWMAIASGDPTMLRLCQPGEDPHSFMGARVNGVEYKTLMKLVEDKDPKAKEMRQLGKVGNLSLQYRTSALKFRSVARVQYSLDMDEGTARLIHGEYRAAYREVPTYWLRQINTTRSRGYVETFAGRRVYVVGNWDGPLGWSMSSTAINYRIQGTGADQKYLAMAVLRPYLKKMRIRFAWDLHDGLYFYVPDEVVSEVIPVMRNMLDNLPYEKAWGLKPPIPMPWDCKVGKSWGALKEWGK